jgi:hypothetical protein
MTPHQHPILFPPALTQAQLAASRKLAEMVEAKRASFEVRDFVRRRRAAKRGTRNG